MRRYWAMVVAIFLLFSACALGEEETRYAQVFDTGADAGRLTARFLYVGPDGGDSIILTSPDGKVMLVDAALEVEKEYILAALDAIGIERIDYLVASHPHTDHIGGMPAVIEAYDIGTFYLSALDYPAKVMAAAEAKGIEPVILSEGDSFSFGEDVLVEIFNPVDPLPDAETYPLGPIRFINNQSLVMKFTYGESTLLLAGDLYSDGERDVISRWGEALDCDVMKANHHGDDTSSSINWRKTVTPRITCITSSDIKDLSVMRMYIKDGQQMFHTGLDGCVRISTAGDSEYDVLTERDRTTDLFN